MSELTPSFSPESHTSASEAEPVVKQEAEQVEASAETASTNSEAATQSVEAALLEPSAVVDVPVENQQAPQLDTSKGPSETGVKTPPNTAKIDASINAAKPTDSGVMSKIAEQLVNERSVGNIGPQ